MPTPIMTQHDSDLLEQIERYRQALHKIATHDVAAISAKDEARRMALIAEYALNFAYGIRGT